MPAMKRKEKKKEQKIAHTLQQQFSSIEEERLF
jgi:hypothetical protein